MQISQVVLNQDWMLLVARNAKRLNLHHLLYRIYSPLSLDVL